MSEDSPSLEGISLESVRVLVELFDGLPRIEERLLRRRYEERALAFDRTLVFVSALEILAAGERTVSRGRLYVSVQAAMEYSARAFAEGLLRLTLKSRTMYAQKLGAVLAAFRLDEGTFRLASTELSGEQYAARDFLMETSAIQTTEGPGYYLLNDWFLADYLSSQFLHGTPPEKLDEIRERQADIGLAAELEVMDYERRLVGPEDLDLVVHVAGRNTGAGFDITSVRRDAITRRARLRLIEVKAVSPVDWFFTLTRNERAVAVESAASYFLYLVPVVKGKPDVGELVVVADPVGRLTIDCGWQVVEGDWQVRKAGEHA